MSCSGKRPLPKRETFTAIIGGDATGRGFAFATHVKSSAREKARMRADLACSLRKVNDLGGVEVPPAAIENGEQDGVIAQLHETLRGVVSMLPLLLLDEDELGELRDELDKAREGPKPILKFVNIKGVIRAHLGIRARKKLREAHERDGSYPLLVAFIDRWKAIIAAAPEHFAAWLGEEVPLLVREVPAGQPSTPTQYHADWKQSDRDERLPWQGDKLRALSADADRQVMLRAIYTFGTTTATRVVDVLGGEEVRFEAGCPGAAVGIDGTRRAVTPGRLNRLHHAGEDVGMPLRLQIVPDLALSSALVYNKLAANFLLQDLLSAPPAAFDAGLPAHAHALRCLAAVARG